MFSAQNRQKNKNIQPGPEKQHLIKQKIVQADFDFNRLSFHLQNECLCKTFLVKIMKMT